MKVLFAFIYRSRLTGFDSKFLSTQCHTLLASCSQSDLSKLQVCSGHSLRRLALKWLPSLRHQSSLSIQDMARVNCCYSSPPLGLLHRLIWNCLHGWKPRTQHPTFQPRLVASINNILPNPQTFPD